MKQAGEAIAAATMPISAMEATDLISKLESEGRTVVVFFRASDHSVYLQQKWQIAFVDNESLGLATELEKGNFCIVPFEGCEFSYRDEVTLPGIFRTDKYEGTLSISLPSKERIWLRILRSEES